ncbi:uncharacterized protein LOC126579079 [Anopheles aquasalis]|uniref:uncharacterized protein LOC126579079 n=1 Tax=Anopheles aquasalis TaxID=42839 RepID=UPI00215AAEE8|nr:uncharacterized protein LOC126579079 [Anopheles aquasalis]
MATLLTQCFTGLLLYEASLKFEDVEILYQISTTVNDYHMTYVSNELTTNQLEGDNTPSSQIIPSCKKKGWWIALKMAGKSTTVYALMLLINLIYLWLFKTYRLNIMLLLAFYFTNTLGLICRLFVTFYGTKILKKRNRDLASWSPYLNVLGDVINMIGLRVLLFLYPLAEISLFEPV